MKYFLINPMVEIYLDHVDHVVNKENIQDKKVSPSIAQKTVIAKQGAFGLTKNIHMKQYWA